MCVCVCFCMVRVCMYTCSSLCHSLRLTVQAFLVSSCQDRPRVVCTAGLSLTVWKYSPVLQFILIQSSECAVCTFDIHACMIPDTSVSVGNTLKLCLQCQFGILSTEAIRLHTFHMHTTFCCFVGNMYTYMYKL